MQAVIEERPVEHEYVRKAGNKCKEPFVGFDNSAFGNRQDLVQNLFAVGDLAGSEEAAMAAEQSGCFRGARGGPWVSTMRQPWPTPPMSG